MGACRQFFRFQPPLVSPVAARLALEVLEQALRRRGRGRHPPSRRSGCRVNFTHPARLLGAWAPRCSGLPVAPTTPRRLYNGNVITGLPAGSPLAHSIAVADGRSPPWQNDAERAINPRGRSVDLGRTVVPGFITPPPPLPPAVCTCCSRRRLRSIGLDTSHPQPPGARRREVGPGLKTTTRIRAIASPYREDLGRGARTTPSTSRTAGANAT